MKPLAPESWPDESMFFGLAIQVSDPASNQLHAAVLYRFDGQLMVGDVQNHFQSRRAKVPPGGKPFFWIAPGLSNTDQRILAAKVDAWLEINAGKIPYSVAHPGGVIFKENIWVGDEAGQGLTCATFVVALFDELGIPFIDIDTWEARPGDEEWANRILSALAGLMTPQHVEAQRNRIGETARVRPADVAAACLAIHAAMLIPLHFQQIAPMSADIESSLLVQ